MEPGSGADHRACSFFGHRAAVWEIPAAFLSPGSVAQTETDRRKTEVLFALRTGSAPWLERRVEYGIVPWEGKTRQIESIQFIVPATGGNCLGAIIRDITERWAAERALQDANRKLHLMSSIARHDINNQIAIFSGYLTLLREGTPAMDQEAYLQKLMISATAIQKILALRGNTRISALHRPPGRRLPVRSRLHVRPSIRRG
jgi:signal transduction histidine kinase